MEDNTQKKIQELMLTKACNGYRNVDIILESTLYSGVRLPRVALFFAESSISDQELRAAIQSTSGDIDYNYFGTTFTLIPNFIHKLESLDALSYDVICLVRGGDTDDEDVFNNIDIAKAVAKMKTPIISAIGHPEELPMASKVADKNIGTAALLGVYFKEIVDRVVGERERAKAELKEQIKKLFADQLETQEKRIADLQKQLSEQSVALPTSNKDLAKELADTKIVNKELQEQLRAAALRAVSKRKRFAIAITCLSVALLAAVAICIYVLTVKM